MHQHIFHLIDIDDPGWPEVLEGRLVLLVNVVDLLSELRAFNVLYKLLLLHQFSVRRD